MLIGLSGYAQSGKDTVAGMLIGLYGYENRAFAEPMRTALYKLDPIVSEDGMRLKSVIDEFGWEHAKKHTDTRRLLQVLGTEIGREMFGEDFWVIQAIKGLHSLDDIVFTDVRFPNEAKAIKEMKGQVWRIKRPGYVPVNAHPSESSMDDWGFDYTIDNDSDLESLKSKTAEAIGWSRTKFDEVKKANG